ncbi:YafY family transcriptional regulator [Rhodococcus sp. HNM0563]|uniref:helix-turn-helix transcriptional regulator n=1 Tax=unclassified Rhodococcus (in: high G+C Gram-positive bacteria) TaxID=192944 RepID=UPI00146A0E4A|nr:MULTISPECIES: YafY family protein [unclassified Rhodococcus (in: high G+C Gram-positive bacteria)]MCK0093048.1 YafY family transcriptional regulator [Rhodococcus sp. F64268]NLU62603.1 YafY family transcriptional regulator [Rhodococcus sp. HNM0563]
MRAERLLSLVLMLRNRGRMTAPAIARELEVSVRTVLRDVEALSSAGIPVYAERGRDGGFALLPGFTTDLTGLTIDEATALLAASASTDTAALGMAPAFAAAMRKVTDALPEAGRTAAIRASERILVTGSGWITDSSVDPHLGAVQQAVFDGVRLRIRYRPRDRDAGWRTVDPVGVVSAAGRWYLVALHRGDERTYRLSRIDEVKVLDVKAERPDDVDLAEIWQRRRARFRAGMPTISATVKVRESRRDELAAVAISVAERPADDERWCLAEVEFGSSGHAGAVMWQLGDDAELLAPQALRDEIRMQALKLSARHR